MHLSREIEIAAPPEVVWDISVDVTRWPQWTPTVLMWPVLALALRRVLRQEAEGLKALAETRAKSA